MQQCEHLMQANVETVPFSFALNTLDSEPKAEAALII